MLGFIARYFSSLWELITAPLRAVWRVIVKIFPPRDCTIMDIPNARVYTYQQSSFLRFAKFCALITMMIWASWSTYVYVYHRPLLQKRTQQLERERDRHDRHLTDLKIYLDKFNNLTKNLNMTDDKLLKAEKDKLSDKEKEDLLNTKSKIVGELGFLQGRIADMMDDKEYIAGFDKISELSVEYELLQNENNLLKQQNSTNMESVEAIVAADDAIVAAVTKMTSENIEELQNQLKKIKSNIKQLGLNEQKLIEMANETKNQFVGGVYNPLKLGKNADIKYKKGAKDLEQWNGLKRLTQMLPMGAPVANMTITSNFGMRKDPFTKKNKQHKGIDFAGKIGTELYAVAPGRVVSAGDRYGYGLAVEIDHGLGFTTLYAHLSKTMVARGDWVRPGNIIGLGGSSGRSTGPHLHYEIRYKGNPFNPSNFVKE